MKQAIIFMIITITAVTFFAGIAAAAGDEITVTGTIRLVGNEPFPELIVTTDNKENYSITGPKKSELLQKQGQKLTLTGKKGKGSGVYAPSSIDVENYHVPEIDSPLTAWLKRLFGWK